MNKICKYDVCWKGDCDNEVPEENTFCDEHENIKCIHCDKKAVRDCHKFNGSFVCGAPLCKECTCGHK